MKGTVNQGRGLSSLHEERIQERRAGHQTAICVWPAGLPSSSHFGINAISFVSAVALFRPRSLHPFHQGLHLSSSFALH